MRKKGIFKKYIKPVATGIFKSLPIGNVIIESVRNVKSEMESAVTGEVKETPHNWLSIAIQLICIIGIIYAFVSKQITIEQFIELLPK